MYDQAPDTGITESALAPAIIRPLATEWDTIEPSVQAVLSLQIPHIGFGEVEMIHRLRTRGPTTLDTMPGILAVRRLNLARTIAQNPHLMYGLIAASALHSKFTIDAESESSRRLEEKAMTFYQLSLSEYRLRLNSFDEITCSSLFSFSVTLAGLTFASMPHETLDHRGQGQTYIDKIIDTFNLLLGAVAVANEANCLHAIADYLTLSDTLVLSDSYEYMEEEVYNNLTSLSSRISSAHRSGHAANPHVELVDISNIYESAIPKLINMFFSLQKPEPDNVMSVFSWAALVGKPFVLLLEQRHPAALIVLAHYGVALLALSHIWWFQSVGVRTIRSVAEVTASGYSIEWQELLKWPLKRVEDLQVAAPNANVVRMYHPGNIGGEDHDSLRARAFEVSLLWVQTDGIRETNHVS